MNARIFNRDFEHPADGWYCIEPKGEHLNKASNVVQVIDNEAARSIVNRFNADATAGRLSHGSEMLIDHEHFKHDLDKETTAYGWLSRLQNRDDGIYGQIRWTGTGKQAVDNGDYRFFSTEYDPGDLEVLNSGSPRRVRPSRLDGLTLTNQPNNKGGKPITNRAEETGANGLAAPRAYQGGGEPVSIHPALDAWFDAVHAVMKSARNKTHTAMSLNQAWPIAKQVHPEKHAAAFNPVTSAAQTDLPGAAQMVNEICNRVNNVMGYGARAARIFLRESEPQIFTAMRAKLGIDGVMNREGKMDALSPQAAAGKLFQRLVEEDMKAFGISTSHAFARVSNREQTLAALAGGKITCDQAFQTEPKLRNRLS